MSKIIEYKRHNKTFGKMEISPNVWIHGRKKYPTLAETEEGYIECCNDTKILTNHKYETKQECQVIEVQP